MIKKYIGIVLAITVLFLPSSCNKVLDQTNITAINPDQVWNDPALMSAYVNGFHNALMPGMPTGSGNATDEAVDINNSVFLNGTATVDSYNYWPYSTIRTINILLESIDKGMLTVVQKEPLKGQAYFWRAWAYFSMVKAYGGVPLVLDVQDPSADVAQLQVKRNKTSECIAQIARDLDSAAALLPPSWGDADYGRVDKCAAMAFKAKVLLFYASPQFNPTHIDSRWQDAYNAAKAAKEFCESRGKGLMDKFSDIWDTKKNKEVIMVRPYKNPDATYFSGGLRPIKYSNGAAQQDDPAIELVDAFPMSDGSKWDTATMSHDTLYRHRDERFYATIGYNGAAPYLADMSALNENLWTYIKPDGTRMDGGCCNTLSSFYRVKMMDRAITQAQVSLTSTDWPEIRFAEVLMDYGEAANETGNTGEALQVLYAIRQRAGITPGSGGEYGITAVTQADIRKAYMDEEYVEFAFENKRWDNLRRLRMLDTRFNTLKRRHGLQVYLKAGFTGPAGLDNIDNFTTEFNTVQVATDVVDFNVRPEYYFYAIPKSILDADPNLAQTNGWPGGTFDPLQ
ncbi:MAG TPA: RagB/SusD family nutrient uptake outer membrane protein [Puia sp.]|jgi:hypothetical protein